MTNFKQAALAALLLAAPVAPLAAQAVPGATIVVVDMDRLINQSAAGRVATADLKTKQDAIQARVTSLRTQFGNEEQALLKTRPTAAGPAVAPWEAKVRDLQNRKQAAETDLQKRSQELRATQESALRQINTAAQPILAQIMRERGANLVVPQAATLQFNPALNVTAEAMTRLDRTLPRVAAAAPAK